MKVDNVLELIKYFNQNHPLNIYDNNSVSGHINLICNAAKEKGLVVKKKDKKILFLIDGNIVGGLNGMKPHTTSFLAVRICADKDKTKSNLSYHGVPVPNGKKFSVDEYEKALKYVQEQDRKFVLKPVNLSQGRGITVNVDTNLFHDSWTYCINAQIEAGKKNQHVLIEDFHEGFEIRALVIEGKFFCAMTRLPANVIGDGVSSIRSLIEKKNEQRMLNPHLYDLPIIVDSHGEKLLKRQGLTLDTIPSKEEIVVLHEKTNISSGGDNVDITDIVCDGLKEIAVQAVKAIPGLDTAGVDIITTSLDHSDDAVVIEVNTNANFGIHHYPMFGLPRDPAGALITSFLFKQKTNTHKKNSLDWEDFFVREQNRELTTELGKSKVALRKFETEKESLIKELKTVKNEKEKLVKERNRIKHQYKKILQSRSWRYTKPIRKIMSFIKTTNQRT